MLKNILRALKLHESTLSMLLGALVIVTMGVIVINYFRGQSTGEVVPGEATEQPRIIPGEGPVQYTVSEGETLWSIAETQYGSGYNWVDIAQENNLADANTITAGESLTIPDVEPKLATVSETSTTMGNLMQQDAITGATYTVVHGDNLWEIAVRAYGDGYRWTEIAQANDLTNPSIIHSGNVLSLPR